MSSFNADFSELQAFFGRLKSAANGDLTKELTTFLDGVGVEFLRLLTDEFTSRHRNTGTGDLVNSLRVGDKDNIWELEDNGLTLTVGTNVDYASYVNDGHRTLDPEKDGHFILPNGELARFVPGHWQGNRFIYEPGADTGMVLKLHWVEGIHFWEPAEAAIQKILKESLDRKLQEWLDKYFGQ